MQPKHAEERGSTMRTIPHELVPQFDAEGSGLPHLGNSKIFLRFSLPQHEEAFTKTQVVGMQDAARSTQHAPLRVVTA